MRPRVVVVASGVMLLAVCSFAIVPLLALYLSTEHGVPASRIGVVLAVMALANQGLQVLLGTVADRVGSRVALTAGICLASVGYLGFALATGFPGQLGCAATLGIGRALLSLVGKMLLLEVAGGDGAPALTLRTMMVNVGSAVGPLLGGLLFGGFRAVLFAGVAMHLVVWAVLVRHAAGRPAVRRDRAGLRDLCRNVPLVGITAASTGFWFLYTQLTVTFPLYVNEQFDMRGSVGLLFALNAALAVALQFPVLRILDARIDSWRAIVLGCVAVGAGFLVLGAVPAIWGLVVFVVLFSVGEIVVVPKLDVLTAYVAPAGAVAGAFGFASLGWAAGGFLGSLLGGLGYQAASRAGRLPLFWSAGFAVGCLAAAAFAVLAARLRHRRIGVV
jgi:DHA1 family multidrug resistance protein-like MFS transporter